MRTKKTLFLLIIALLTISLLAQAVSAGFVLTVYTSDDIYAISYPFQRKTFYANGRFWVFFTCSINNVFYIAYSTSTDGISWTFRTTIRPCDKGYKFSIWFNGTYLHYAYASGSYIYYRRGLPNNDGSITWSTDAEQTVSTAYNSASYPFVSTDSSGYVWIGYMDYDGENFWPYVIKSQYNNGSWGTTPSGFPHPLSDVSSASWRVSPIPLTNGKMLVIYAYSGSTVKAKRWTGSSWGDVRYTTSAIQYGYEYSAVAQGDDVHLAFLKSTGYDIKYVKYVYANDTFTSEVTIQSGATSTSAPVLSMDNTNKLYVFWATKTTGSPAGATANHIYYQTSTDGGNTWSAMVDWIDASAETLTSADRLSCFYRQYGSYIVLLFMTNTGILSYNIKFSYLTAAAMPEERSFSFTETVNLIATLIQWQEVKYFYFQTVATTETLIYYQECIYVFQEIVKPSMIMTTSVPVVKPPINYFVLFVAVLTLFVLMLVLEGGHESRHSVAYNP